MIQTNRKQNSPITSSTSNMMDYIYLLWQWAWLIIIVSIIAGGAAYIYFKTSAPTYLTNVRLYISNPIQTSYIDTSGINTYTLTDTYSAMITDSAVLKGVIAKLNLGISPDELQGMINVEPITNTQLISISVSGTNQEQIINIANTLGTVFAQHILDMQHQRYAANQQALQAQIDAMKKQIDTAAAAVDAASDYTSRSTAQAQLTEYEDMYSNLLAVYQQGIMDETQNVSNVIIADPASVANQTGPKTMQNTVLAIVFGILVSGGVIFGINALDNTIKNPDDIRQKFNLPILGIIANYQITKGKSIALVEPRSVITEAYRKLRTNINYVSIDRPLRRVVVTSAVPADGKTNVITNLAVVIAQSGKTITVIDADLRRPELHNSLGMENRFGLSDLFVCPAEEFNNYIQTNGIGGLSIITSGNIPPNPTELLTSHKMTEILDRINQNNELILIDTPPIVSVTDGAALAAKIDGVILVVRPGETPTNALAQTVEQLDRVGARILGVVINNVNIRNRRYGYYYRPYFSKETNYYKASRGKRGKSLTEAKN
jgi:capsular exopolysaccharide synthesis family protein